MSVNGVKSLKYNLIGGGLPLGCKVKDGKIVPALSAGKLDTTCPSNIRYATFIHYSDRLYVMNNMALYTSEAGGSYRTVAYEDAALPFFIEYRDGTQQVSKIVFDSRGILFKGKGEALHSVPYRICGGVYKNGRVFAIDLDNRYKLCWSGEKGIDDWEEKIDGAGWLYTDAELGEIINLLVFKGHIAIIKKYGISLLSAYGAPENFKEIVNVSTPAIYQNTAVVCGNKVYFYTADGLYAFNAAGTEKIDLKLAEDFSSAVYAMTYGGSVFFAGTHKKLRRVVVLVYDTKEKTSYLIDVPATALAAGNDPYAYIKGGAVKLEKGAAFTYASEEIGHFSKRKKTLKSIFLDCTENVDITVDTESRRRQFKDVKGRVQTNISGSHFKVSVTGKNAEIKEFTANVEYY